MLHLKGDQYGFIGKDFKNQNQKTKTNNQANNETPNSGLQNVLLLIGLYFNYQEHFLGFIVEKKFTQQSLCIGWDSGYATPKYGILAY